MSALAPPMAIGWTQNMYGLSLVSERSSRHRILSIWLLHKYKYFPSIRTGLSDIPQKSPLDGKTFKYIKN